MNSVSAKTFWIRCSCLFGVVVLLMTVAWAAVNSAEQTRDKYPLPVFTDITQQAGLNMKIYNGDETTVVLMDINGTGACFLDYDNDGYQDIFLVNGTSRKSEAAGLHPHDYLLRNNGDGTFTDVTA